MKPSVLRTLLVLALLLVPAAAFLHSRMPPASLGKGGQPGSPAAGPAGGSPGQAPAQTAIPVSRAAASHAGPAWVLPPENAELAPVMPALVRAARNRDPGAMCRLAAEMQRCGAWLPMLRAERQRELDRLQFSITPMNEFNMKLFESHGEQLAREERVCAGAEMPADLKAWQLLRDAARAGHVPSMSRFVRYFPIDPTNSLGDMGPWVALRDEGRGFLERAAKAGDVGAALELFSTYAGNAGMLAVADPDPQLALAYALALRDVGDERTRTSIDRVEAMLRKDLAPAQVRAAERMAARLSPAFDHARGQPLDLIGRPDQGGEDCRWADPQLRHPSPASPGRESQEAR